MAAEVAQLGTWGDLLDYIGIWQRAQFPRATSGGAARHLVREAAEIAEHPNDGEEWVDALHIVIQGAMQVFPTRVAFFKAVQEKLLINIWRKWQEPDNENVVEHVRSIEPDTIPPDQVEDWNPFA